MTPNKKCEHSIEWDDKSLHRPNPELNFIILIGKCKHCRLPFKRQYKHTYDTKFDHITNLFMPYYVHIYEQVLINIKKSPDGPTIHWGKDVKSEP